MSCKTLKDLRAQALRIKKIQKSSIESLGPNHCVIDADFLIKLLDSEATLTQLTEQRDIALKALKDLSDGTECGWSANHADKALAKINEEV